MNTNKLICLFSIILLPISYSLFSMEYADVDAIKAQLRKMVKTDQEARSKIDINDPDEDSLAEMKQLDIENVQRLKEILSEYEWITISRFGKQADRDAWLIVQHADFDGAFQQEILSKLEHLYPLGETSPINYAYLYDRVAMNQGKPQRYGTQGEIKDGTWILHIVEDLDNLDNHRKQVGLNAYHEYVCQIERVYNLR